MAWRSRPGRLQARRRGLAGSTRALIVLVVAAIALRSIVVAPFSIPSDSMLPLLRVGDVLLVAKWPYGWSRHSFPLSLPPFPGRVLASLPARGDVVVFKNPADGRTDFIKRVIGLPGDRVEMRGGTLMLNGRAVPKLRVADLVIPVHPNDPCPPRPGLAIRIERDGNDGLACRYPRYRETLPGGRAYAVLDIGDVPAADTVAAVTVPAGHLFVLGDNRDRSADSRIAVADGGTGLVPIANIVGRASVLFFSSDGSARLTRPTSWLGAVRGDRIGEPL